MPVFRSSPRPFRRSCCPLRAPVGTLIRTGPPLNVGTLTSAPKMASLIVIGTVYGRVEMFVDIATGYALVNLVGSLAIAKYLEERGKSADVS